VTLFVLALAAPAAAQEPPSGAAATAPDDAPSSPFLARADFSFGFAGLHATDPRFDWHATIGFDLDVYGYSSGRLRFRGDYEAFLGRERRPYDLNQGNYVFEIAGTRRFKRVELGVQSQHVSRHLVDRENPPSISWNTVGVRAQSIWTANTGLAGSGSSETADAGRSDRVDGEIEISRAMQQAYVDYSWISRAKLSWWRPLTSVASVKVRATGEVTGVKHGVVRNERVCGGRIEGSLQLRGRAAILEIFGGYERRIDAYPTDRFRVRWFTAGARVVTTPFW
jgi:hypothetical protein